MPEPAFQHAVEADAVDIAVQILDHYANYMLNAGELRVIERWVALLPAAWYSEYPMLGLARAGLQAFNGEFEACTRTIDSVEQSLLDTKRDEEDWHWQMARIKAIRCLMACIRNDLTLAEDFADLALQELPEDNLGWRPGIYNALGDTNRQNGRWQDSKACYLEALAVTASPQSRFMSVRVYGALADLSLRQGQLRDAEYNWRQALATIEERESWGRLPAPVIGWVYIRLAELLYERDDLAEAWDHLSRALEHAELGGDLRSMIAAYLIAVRLKLSQGENEAAEEYLELARPLVERSQFAHWTSRFERLQLEVWLAQDRLKVAVDWADQTLHDSEIEQRPESEVAQLAMVRVLIVNGDRDSIDRALTLLRRLLTEAEAEGRMGIRIESLALQQWQTGNRTGAWMP